MHQALERDGTDKRRSVATYALHRDRPNERIVGRVVAKGLGGDELGDNGPGFQLVPWNDTLAKRLGQQVDGIPMPGGGIDWTLGRNRGLGI